MFTVYTQMPPPHAAERERDMIKVILWDVDGTLLNFLQAEKCAIRACFSRFGLGECTDEMLADYSEINRRYWKMLERGEMTKPQILEGRFREFFGNYGLDTSCVADFNREYQLRLGDTVVFNDDAFALLRRLAGRVKQYAVTNGTRIAQERKLRASELDTLLDGIFISEVVGAEKPSPVFFDAVFAAIGPCEKDEVLIVGDSLTSDMRGGNNAGVRCCWYNPEAQPGDISVRIDHEIRDLREVE